MSIKTTRQTIDLLLEPRWIAAVDPDVVLKNHAVAVHDGRIVDVLPTGEARDRFDPGQRVVLEDHILIPGLVNLHTHAAMTLMRGLADDLPLMDWLEKHIWPAESANVSQQFVYDGTRLACAEMLAGGITCFNDMYFYPEAAAAAVAEFGMRAMLGITAIEFPTPYASDADDYIDKGLAVREQWLNHPLIGFCLAPHAPYTVSDATFERLATLAAQINIPIHCHIHETRREIEESRHLHGLTPLARLQRLGLLGPGFIDDFGKPILNIHPSLLPSFPGMHAQKQALEAGVRWTGATVHFVDSGLDSGPILLQEPVRILMDDSETSLSARVLETEHRLYPAAVDLVACNNYQIRGRKVFLSPSTTG